MWAELARRFGHHLADDAREVFDELPAPRPGAGPTTRRSATSGSTPARRCSGSPADAPSGTPRLFLDRFPTVDGRAHLVAVDHHGPADDAVPPTAWCTWSPAGCCTTTSRARRPVGCRVRRGRTGAAARDPPPARRHPRRHRRGCRVTSARGVPRRDGIRDDRDPADTVFLPFHWAGELSANLLTNDAVDPVSGMPEFGLRGARAGAPPPGGPVMRRVVVVGHGMVGLGSPRSSSRPTRPWSTVLGRSRSRRTTGCCPAWSPGRRAPELLGIAGRRTSG